MLRLERNEKETIMTRNFSFVSGRMAALSIAVETTVFVISLIWEVTDSAELAKNLEYFVR